MTCLTAELRAAQAEALGALYGNTRAQGLNAEVKRRILMGTHALSAGYFDAYYKRAQQVLLSSGVLTRGAYPL